MKKQWIYWFFLFLAIIFEVAGTTVMKASQSWPFQNGALLGLVLMWTCLGISYYSLARSAVMLPIGVAFALWDAFGLTLITSFSLLFLGENMTLTKGLGLLCCLCGGLLVHHGTDSGHD